MAQPTENTSFDFEAMSRLYSQPTLAESTASLLPAATIESQAKKGTKRKAEAANVGRVTRSQVKATGAKSTKSEPAPKAVDKPVIKKNAKGPAVKRLKEKILVPGTLGSGDNAIQVHTDPATPSKGVKKQPAATNLVQDSIPEPVVEQKAFSELSTAEQWVLFREFVQANGGTSAPKRSLPASSALPSPDPTPVAKKTKSRPVVLSDDDDASSNDGNPFINDEAEEADDDDDDDDDDDNDDNNDDDSEGSEEGSSSSEDEQTECEVTKPDSGDPLLRDTIEGLPMLKRCGLAGVAGVVYLFEEWLKMKSFPVKAAKSCIAFSRIEQYINLSRCDPSDLNVYVSSGKKPKRYLQVGKDSAVCLTPMAVGLALLGQTRNDLGGKEIGGILHSHEFERFFATTAMAYNVDRLKPNIWKNLFKFVTYGDRYGDGAFSAENTVASDLFKNTSVSTAKGRILPPLSADAKVPVFDARGKSKFRLDKVVRELAALSDSMSIVEKMRKVGLKEYNENINGGSFVVVAHTVTAADAVWDNETVLGITCNIQWVILLAEGSHKAPL